MPGSPPRMRERPFYTQSRRSPARITPAYAGKTELDKLQTLHSRDHPRVCGKDRQESVQAFIDLGSPPRMRERPSRS